jgi:non-homologous end joining protein Ku
MRPYWKGYLKLALVSCPIALHAACSSAERIAFRQVNKATGNRLRHQLIDEETLIEGQAARRLDSERFRSTPRTCGHFRGILSLR